MALDRMDKEGARGAEMETATDKATDKAADGEQVAAWGWEWGAVKVAGAGWDKIIHGCKPNSATCKPPLKN